LRWAEERLISEQYGDARAQVAEQLAKWGVSDAEATAMDPTS
jgi:hypothetical protein